MIFVNVNTDEILQMITTRLDLERILERLPEEALYQAILIVLDVSNREETQKTELPAPSVDLESFPREGHQ